jgi:hypothetical protein
MRDARLPQAPAPPAGLAPSAPMFWITKEQSWAAPPSSGGLLGKLLGK